MTDEEHVEFLRVRKEAGLKIDPATAEFKCVTVDLVNPYGVPLPGQEKDEVYDVGEEYFARSPGSEIWILFDDLPEATKNVLWERDEQEQKKAAPICLAVIEAIIEAYRIAITRGVQFDRRQVEAEAILVQGPRPITF